MFCGGKPTTVEHVLSRKWIGELMPDSQSFTTRITRTDEEGEAERRSFKTKAGVKAGGGSHPVKCACESCNNGWMQDLDNTLRPALSGLALGQVGTLSLEGCRLLATWATKLSILTDEMWKPTTLSSDLKRSFGRDRQLPKGWQYFVALRDDTADESHLRAVTLTPDPTSKHVEAVVFTVRVLHLIVQTLAPIEPVILRYRASGRPYVQSLWPRQGPLSWPLPQRMWVRSDEELQRLAESAIEARRAHA